MMIMIYDEEFLFGIWITMSLSDYDFLEVWFGNRRLFDI